MFAAGYVIYIILSHKTIDIVVLNITSFRLHFNVQYKILSNVVLVTIFFEQNFSSMMSKFCKFFLKKATLVHSLKIEMNASYSIH